jgi:hypothetical protein
MAFSTPAGVFAAQQFGDTRDPAIIAAELDASFKPNEGGSIFDFIRKGVTAISTPFIGPTGAAGTALSVPAKVVGVNISDVPVVGSGLDASRQYINRPSLSTAFVAGREITRGSGAIGAGALAAPYVAGFTGLSTGLSTTLSTSLSAYIAKGDFLGAKNLIENFAGSQIKDLAGDFSGYLPSGSSVGQPTAADSAAIPMGFSGGGVTTQPKNILPLIILGAIGYGAYVYFKRR